MTRLISGKIKKTPSANADPNRYSWLDLQNAEPDLGVPSSNGSLFVSTVDGTRSWSNTITVSGTVATINTLTVTGNSNLGSNSNIKITGGSPGQFLVTDGTADLFWSSAAISNASGISNDQSNVVMAIPNGNIAMSVAGTSNVIVVSNVGAIVTGNVGVNGNITAANITANTGVFTGNGSGLSAIAGANITGNVANATTAATAGTVTTNAQPNITSVGTLTGLGVNGSITAANFTANTGIFTGNGSGLSAIAGANVTGTVPSATSATTAGAVTTNAQPNITSVGTLTGLTIGNATANTVFGNGTINANGNITAPFVFANVIGNVSGNITVSGSNGEVLFNNDGNSGTSNAFSFNRASNVLTVTGNVDANFFNGNGSALSSITGANVTGTVSAATTAGTVTTNAQPNITSVGTLTSLGVNGNVTAANITANTGIFTGNGSGLSAIAGANITGNVANATFATSAGTVTTNAQPNITSVGTLSSLNVSGNAIISGNLAVDGNLVYVNVETLSVEDPIIQLQTGPNGAAPIANSGKDIGTALNYYDTQARVAFMGWDVSNVEFGLASQASISSEVVTFTSYGNLRVGNIIGNGQALTGLNGANVTGTVANATFATSAGSATTAGTVTTNAQSNITSVGTLTGLDVNGNITAANITANTGVFTGNGSGLSAIAGGNVTGNVSNATFATTAGTVTTNAQPNITSVGTLSSLTATGNVTGGNLVTAGKVYSSEFINGGTGIYLSAGPAGYINFFTTGGDKASISDTGNIIASNLIANSTVFAVTANVSGNVNAGNVSATTFTGALSGAATSAGTVTTNAQPNITSTGTLTGLNVNGNITAANITANTGVFTGNGSGLSALAGGNVTGNVANATFATSAGTAGTVTTNAQPNITSVGTLTGLTIGNATSNAVFGNGTINATGNITAPNFFGNLVGNITGNLVVPGLTGEVLFNDAGNAAASNAFSFNNVSNALSVNGTMTAVNVTANTGVFTGNGSALTALNASNISTGTLAQARLANSNVVINTQTIALGGTATITANTTNTLTRGAYLTGTDFNGGTATTWAVDATTTNTANKVVARDADGSFSANIITATLSGSATSAGTATTAGTVTTNAQPNITSVGTLTGLTVGNATSNAVFGNGTINATGNITAPFVFANVVGNISGNFAVTGSNGEVIFNKEGNAGSSAGFTFNNASNALSVNGTVTAVNVTANTGVFTGNGSALTALNASNISTGTLAQGRLANSSLTVNGQSISLGSSGTITANTTNTLTRGTYLTGTDFNGGTAATWAVDATVTNTANKVVARDADGSFSANIITATLSGSATSAGTATTAGTVTTNAQSNITSVGTLTGLTVGNATANTVFGNGTINAGGNITAPFFLGNVIGNISGNFAVTGSNREVIFNKEGNAGSSSAFTFDNASNALTVTGNITGDNLITGGIVSATGNIVTNANLVTNLINGRTAGVTITAAGTNTNITLAPNGTGTVDVSSKRITNLATPSATTDAVNKQYVDDVAQGLTVKAACKAATTGTLAVASSGTITYDNGASGVGATLTTTGSYTTIDGVTLADGDRILVKNEAAPANNGIYVRTSSTVLTRATDFDNSPAGEVAGAFTFITNGSTNADAGFVCTTNNPVVMGTTAINFTQFSGAGTYTAGTGLTLTGSVFSITDTTVTAGSYGNGDRVASFTVNAQGQLTATSNVVSAANAANLTGTTLASGITTSSLTTVGTLGSLSVTANITSGNANLGNLAVANFFKGNGSELTNLPIGTSLANGASSVTIPASGGNVNTIVDGTTRIAATSAGANVTGTLGVSGNANVGNLGTAGLVVATGNVTGGNLVTGGSLSVTANANVGNIGAAAGVFTTISGNGAALTTLNASNISSGTLAQARLANSSLSVNGQSISLGGSGTITANTAQSVTFNSGGSGDASGTTFDGGTARTISYNTLGASPLAGSSSLTTTGNVTSGTWNSAIGTSATLASISGANLTSLNASNISSGTIDSARVPTLNQNTTGSAATVTTNAQPNITSTGTLVNLAVSGTTATTLTDSTVGASSLQILQVKNGTQVLGIGAAMGPGSFNGLVGSNDIVIVGSNTSAQGNANITITPWSTGSGGIRIVTVSNVTSSINLTATTTVLSGALQTANITTGASSTAGTVTGNWTLTSGSRWQATYADLAERYVADELYEPGTVVVLGGEQEVTIEDIADSHKVAGVITTNPAYIMNAELEGDTVVEVALIGRVPCKVVGKVSKGDLLTTSEIAGYAHSNNNAIAGRIIGKALENFEGETGLIEILIGRT